VLLQLESARLRRLAFTVLALAPVIPIAAQQAKITVGNNVRVSTSFPKRRHFEIQMAADPENAKRLIACSVVSSPHKAGTDVVTYVSLDGGLSWRGKLHEDPGQYTADPTCTYGPGGITYFLFGGTVLDSIGRFLHKNVSRRSLDGGVTWEPRVETAWIDRQYLVADFTKGPYRGRLYFNGTDTHTPYSVSLFRSLDSGKTFETPTTTRSPRGAFVIGMGNSVVTADGSVVTAFGETDSTGSVEKPVDYKRMSLRVAISHDGGEHYEQPVTVAAWSMPTRASTGIPTIAVDQSNSPFRDRIYVAYPDAASGQAQAMVAWSSDGGKTWSAPRIVNDNRSPMAEGDPRDHALPVVAVNKNGVVGVSWYDRNDSPNGLGNRHRFSASLDGGETWAPSVAVSEVSTMVRDGDLMLDMRPIGGATRYSPATSSPTTLELFSTFYYDMGHTGGMSADADGVFHALWTDNRSGILQLSESFSSTLPQFA
jgi:hypothetical protein